MSKTKKPKADQVSDVEEVAEKTDEEIQQELAGALEDLFQSQPPESKLRIAELYGIIDEEMEGVYNGTKTAQVALDSAVKRGNVLLRRFERANK